MFIIFELSSSMLCVRCNFFTFIEKLIVITCYLKFSLKSVKSVIVLVCVRYIFQLMSGREEFIRWGSSSTLSVYVLINNLAMIGM